MKLLEIFRFEFVYQFRQISLWLYAFVLIGAAFLMLLGNYLPDAQEGKLLLNSPSVIAYTTTFCSLVWLLIAGAVAGEAAARDKGSKMDALIYTSPISKYEYLGGKFMAALVLNALILLAVPLGILFIIYGINLDPKILGPFRIYAYLTSYAYILLPNAFFVTAIQFSIAAIKRSGIVAYVASLVIFILSFMVATTLFGPLKQQVLGSLIDPLAIVTILNDVTAYWSPIELENRLLEMEGPLMKNRLLWFFITISLLFLTARSFLFTRTVTIFRKKPCAKNAEVETSGKSATVKFWSMNNDILEVDRSFEFRTHLRQTVAICQSSYVSILRSRGGVIFIFLLAILVVLFIYFKMQQLGVPFYPVTQNVVDFLAASLSNIQNIELLIIPLLLIFYAGELVWREREAGISDISNVAPVPDWVMFFGKFLGLSLILLTWLLILTFAGIIAQLSLGYTDIQLKLYIQIIFGLRFTEYLLFVILALVIHTIVNQKYVGHLVSLIIFSSIALASTLGIEHSLLVFGGDPGWSYTEMRGYAGTLEPWLWFKLYWLGWAVLLSMVSILFLVREKESGMKERLKLVRSRITKSTVFNIAVLILLTLSLGFYIYYNTNVLHNYRSSADLLKGKAQYEKLYGRYRGLPQPQLIDTKLSVDIYPQNRELRIIGHYNLVNNSLLDIDTIHVAPVPQIKTEVFFDKPAKEILLDNILAHFIFALDNPLRPGDSITLYFKVQYAAPGFSNKGINLTVVPGGTFFTNDQFLPALGYQEFREMDNPGDRKVHGLPSRPSLSPLEDIQGHRKIFWNHFTTLETTISTSAEETGFAPGEGNKIWTKGDRHYSSFSTSAPIPNQYAFFSGNYAVEKEKWRDENSGRMVDIQILHHPTHTANLDRMMRGIKASLNYFSMEFGNYPYNSLRFIERASTGQGLQSTVINISYQEKFSFFNPDADKRNVDFPFAIVAHEVAHQWWGNQLSPARVEGSGLLTESLAWYSALGVAEEEFGFDYLQRLLSILRQEYDNPKSKADIPLIRGSEWFHNYRKGPLALYTLSKYMGREKVNLALRNLLEKQDSLPGLPNSMDLYTEVQAVTPDTLKYLVRDLFAVNTHWDLKTKNVTATKTAAGNWQVKIELMAQKFAVDSTGIETTIPFDDWVEIGVFSQGSVEDEVGEPLYTKMHHLTSTAETITISVPQQPGFAGIDPYYLLNDWEMDDNITKVKIEK